MKLYHFTRKESLPSILQTGIKANPLAFGNCETIEGLKRQCGVWLTELDSLFITAEERAAMFKHSGKIYRGWLGSQMDDQCDVVFPVRLTVRIGDHDRRLIKFDNSGIIPEIDRVSSRTWLYLRTITPDKFIDIDRVSSRPNEKETRAIAA